MASRMENSAVQITTNAGQVSAVHSAPCAQQEQRHKLLDMCQRHELTDVVLLLQGDARESEVVGQEVVEVAAHRVVLATASPFFHALFTSGMKESRESCPRDTILSVLHTANRLELREVVEICCKQLMLQLSVANCVDIYMCCEQLQMLEHFIYAVGGFNGVAHLASVERFNLKTQQWEEMPLLSTGRSGLAVVALNGLVYAIGGVQIVSMADMSAVASVDATPTRPVGPTKVTLQFVAVGNAPLMKRTKFTVSGHDQLSVVYKFLRKQLRLKDTDSLVARSRRLQIKDSARCSRASKWAMCSY
ncbi:hypothetical protein BBP00_00007877 [Phytophthora kernoviae]|uniref:BTB domain-containing protein n=1 Tax=Phytophthora kernoviae TaxID=325452 RepID=A0A3F2RH28_9STRA|nr:hypothetical protein BBP00_00007877 [Phytophthora kernoviae]